MKRQDIINGLIFLLSFIMTNSGCSGDSTSYSPFKEGFHWEYQLTQHTHNELLIFQGSNVEKTENIKFVAENLPNREMDSKIVTPRKIDINGRISFYFMSEDAGGIYLLATQYPESLEPIMKKPLDYVIKYPIQTGISWDKNYSSFWNNKITIKGRKTIESITDTITTPAGTFQKCLKIKGAGTINSDFNDPLDFDKRRKIKVIINIESYSWYAPGIGNIKEIHKESVITEGSNKEKIYAKELIAQLVSFNKGSK
jgi:hypothetical protein